MAYYLYGKEIIGDILSDGQALPNATSADSTNMVYIGRNTGGRLAISVYARTDISIATAQAFNIELEVFTADTAASAVNPHSEKTTTPNDTANPDCHLYLVHKTSADGVLTWSAGDMIAQFVIPGEWFDLVNYDWLQLKYTTDADESSETVDAFMHAVI